MNKILNTSAIMKITEITINLSAKETTKSVFFEYRNTYTINRKKIIAIIVIGSLLSAKIQKFRISAKTAKDKAMSVPR